MDSLALIASIKRKASTPTTQALAQQLDFLTIADEVILSYISPLMRATREDYGIAHYEVPVVNGTLSYRLPGRAMGNVLREVLAIDSDGTAENLQRYDYSQLAETTGPGFCFDGNTVFLVTGSPLSLTTDVGPTLRLTYYQRPSSLVLPTSVGTVSSLNTGTNAVTLTAAPPGTFTTSAKYDLIRQDSPYETLAIDLVATTVVGSVLTFTSTLPNDLRPGDFVALAGQTHIPQIPLELHPLLAQAASVELLQAVGDLDAVKQQTEKLGRMEADARGLVSQRVDGEPAQVVCRGGLFRSVW